MTRASLRKIILENKIISSVIASLIVAGSTSLCVYLSGGWGKALPPIWSWIKTGWSCVAYSVPVPLSLLVLFAGMAIWFIGRAILRKIQEAIEPTYLDYRKDFFKGVVWCWRYDFRSHLDVASIICLCPNDCTRLVESFDKVGQIGLGCDTCHSFWSWQSLGYYTWNDLQPAIARQIERKLVSGEWQKVVEATKQEE